LPGTRGGFSPANCVGDLFLGGQPLEELLEGTVLVAGVRAAVPVQQPDNPSLDVLLADLFPAGEIGLPAQVAGGEPGQHLRGDPAVQLHQVPLRTAAVQTGVAEMVPERCG
jgi:hypothetical protein